MEDPGGLGGGREAGGGGGRRGWGKEAGGRLENTAPARLT